MKMVSRHRDAVFMIIRASPRTGAGILSDQSIHRAYGSVYIFYGLVVFVLSLLKPCNIALGHYGSSRHNKCALLIILLFDGFAIFVQLIIAGFFLADGQYELYGENSITGRRMDGCKGATCTEEESRKLRADCNRVQVPEESVYTTRDCDAYWGSDRTAGFRLAWLAEYSQAIRYGGDEGKKMALDDLQGKGMCCGFAPPDSCDRIENEEQYPCSGGFEFSGRALSCEGVGRDMLKQRVKCSPKLATARVEINFRAPHDGVEAHDVKAVRTASSAKKKPRSWT